LANVAAVTDETRRSDGREFQATAQETREVSGRREPFGHLRGGDGQMSGQASSYVPTASSACLRDQWSGVGGRSVGRGGSADDDAAAAAAARNK